MIRNVITSNKCWLKPASFLASCRIQRTSSNVPSAQANCLSTKREQKRARSKTLQLSESVKIVKNQYPISFWKRHKEYRNLYVADEDVAREIASKICESDKDVYIFEANPGPGILTKAILESGASRVRIFEEDGVFLAALRDLSMNYPKTLEIVERNFLLLSQCSLPEFQLNFAGIEKKVWSDGIPLKLFFIAYSQQSMNFTRYMFVQMSRFSSLFSFGRCQLFLLLSEREYSHITAKPQDNLSDYTSVTVLYNLFFDVQYIKKYPGTLFLPGMKRCDQESQCLHFVKLTPKENLLETTVPQKILPHLYFFIWQNMGKNTTTVIQTLEQWIPNCGLHFIKRGLHVFAKFKDLTPFQVLEVFKQFSSLPNYNACNFHLVAKRPFKSRKRQKNKH